MFLRLWGSGQSPEKGGDPEETGKTNPDEKVGIIRFVFVVVCVDLFVSRF